MKLDDYKGFSITKLNSPTMKGTYKTVYIAMNKDGRRVSQADSLEDLKRNIDTKV